MTACKDSLSGKKAVSATLAGVLAVGMVPAAAFAAEAPADEAQNDGIELLDTTSPVTLFNAGTIELGNAFSPVSGQTNQFNANANTDGTALDLGTVTVTPKGQAAVTATGDDDYKVTIAKDGTEVSEIKAPGTYTVTVEAVGSDYKGGKVSATITVKGASLANATLFQVNPDDAKDVSDTDFTYTGNVLDLGVQVDGKALKAGTDYTIKFVNAGGDANNDPAVEVKNAGKYYAVITGQGNFTGNVKKIANVEVAKFNLADATISVDDVYGATAAKPSAPTSVKKGSDTLANPAEVKLTLNDGQTWDAKGQYIFTAEAKGNSNITGSNANVTCNKVDAVATFEYDGAAFPTEFTSNNGDKKPVYFDLDKIAAKDAAGKAVAESLIDVTVTDKDGNDATADFEAHKAGTYTVKAAINDDTYTLGGSAECKVVIKEATVVTAENVVVEYQGKIVTSVEKNYDGHDIVASDFTVTVTDAKGHVIKGSTHGLVDAEGKATDRALNAGSYKLVIENDNVVFEGEAVVPITINKVDLSTIRVHAEKPKKFDGTNNAAITYVPKGTEVADLGLEYQSGTDENGEPVWEALPAAAKVTVKDASGKEVTKLEDEGIYTIEIAAADDDAALNYTFPTEVSITVADEANLKFADNVDSSAWYYNEVNKAAELGLMNGYADTNLFGPNDTITRAQVAQVLFNMARDRADMDLPEGSYNEIHGYASFSDVNGKMWYGKAIAWAKAAGIVTGYGDGTFAPENNITREEFATMLARYAQKYGNYTAGSAADFAAYGDASAVDSWAAEYVAWAVKGGYMGKNTNVLTPLANMTRAEAAAMVVRYAG